VKLGPVLILRKIWRQFRNLLLAALIALATLAIWPPGTSSFILLPLLQKLEWSAYDAQYVVKGIQPEKIDSRIAVVGFDSNFLSLNDVRWPPPRKVHAQIIRNLKNAGARLIVYDILLSGPSPLNDPEDDRALDAALKEAKNVVLAARVERDVVQKQITMEAPYYDDALGIDFEAEARIGLTEIAKEEDGIIRTIVPAIRFFDNWEPTLATRAFLELHAPDTEPKVTSSGVDLGVMFVPSSGPAKSDPMYGVRIPTALVNFRGGINAFDATVSLDQVYRNDVAIQRLKDKVVFVGVIDLEFAQKLGDAYATAYTNLRSEMAGGVQHTGAIPGVIVQAHLLNTLLTSSFVETAPVWLRFSAAFVFSFVGIGLARRYLNWRGPFFFALTVAIYIAMAIMLFNSNSLHLPWAGPVLLMTLTTGLVVWNERKGLKRKWSGYVSPGVLEQILRTEEGESAARRYQATIVFGDIRGFTSFSDRHDPELVIRLLNRHFERLTDIIYEEKGTIDKFLGDGILVIFGAPVRSKDAAGRAVRAAVRMQMVSLEPLEVDGEVYRFDTGFGITTGEFVAGHVGSRKRHDFSVIGDVVNVASRLQGVTGEPDVIVDETTYLAVLDRVRAEPLGEVTLKGKPKPVPCFKIIGWRDKMPPS